MPSAPRPWPMATRRLPSDLDPGMRRRLMLPARAMRLLLLQLRSYAAAQRALDRSMFMRRRSRQGPDIAEPLNYAQAIAPGARREKRSTEIRRKPNAAFRHSGDQSVRLQPWTRFFRQPQILRRRRCAPTWTRQSAVREYRRSVSRRSRGASLPHACKRTSTVRWPARISMKVLRIGQLRIGDLSNPKNVRGFDDLGGLRGVVHTIHRQCELRRSGENR